MEGSKKFEDAALRGMTRHHVWKSRTSDLTVVNLRDPSELLGTQEPAAPAATTAAVVAAPAASSAAPAVAAAPPVVSDVKRPAAAAVVAAAAAPTPQPQNQPQSQSQPQPQPQSQPQPRPTTGKQESLNALLSKLQLGRPPMDSAAAAAKVTQPPVTASTAATTTPAAAASVPSSATAVTPSVAVAATTPAAPAVAVPAYLSQPASASAPAPAPATSAPSPPVRVAEVHNPTFPDLKESSAGAVGQFEFITGTNIPGQGVVKKTGNLNEVSSMALFHDPLWGGSSLLDAFSTPPPARKSPKPPQRTSLAELYATTTLPAATTASVNPQNSINVFHTATPPAAMHTPVTSPPVPTMAGPTTLTAAMAPQPMQMMGGMVPGPAPHLAASFPMYTMPLQYVAQPQFAGGVVYNSAAFFPYGATAMMMPQQMGQQMPQGFQMAPASMMRPGTNVKAMPFVPGSTM